MSTLRPCLTITGALLVLCCGVYPALVTAAASVIAPSGANGSLLVEDGKVVGSRLVGQSVADWKAHPEYLWGRPSAASEDAATKLTVSSGSNYGPTNATLVDEVKARVEILRATGVSGPIPADLVTKSASGLDPHVSPEAAAIQAPRIAAARKITPSDVQAIVTATTEWSTLGMLGEPRVNVLLVNRELDRRYPVAPPPSPVTEATAPPSP